MPIGKPHEDLTNRKFNHLTVIRRADSKSNIHRLSWICECICGKQVTRRNDYLLSSRNINHSCGCMHSSKYKLGSASKQWKGVGEVGREYMCSIQYRAKKSNKEFTITLEQIWKLFQDQKGLCALTGFELMLSKSSRYPGNASLDRKDSSKGYTIDNVWWVHKDVNRMKNAYSVERFKEVCKAVANNENHSTS